MAEIHIRQVTDSDLLQLQKISSDTFYETFAESNTEEDMKLYLSEGLSQEKLKQELNDIHSVFYFAMLGDVITGYLKLNFGPSQTDLKDENGVEIERIYVSKDFHGKNIGQTLLEKALDTARSRKAEYVWLGVWEENQKAIRFYRKNGFVEFGQHVFLLGSDEQNDILMKLELK